MAELRFPTPGLGHAPGDPGFRIPGPAAWRGQGFFQLQEGDPSFMPSFSMTRCLSIVGGGGATSPMYFAPGTWADLANESAFNPSLYQDPLQRRVMPQRGLTFCCHCPESLKSFWLRRCVSLCTFHIPFWATNAGASPARDTQHSLYSTSF